MRTDLLLEIADMLDNLTPEERRHFNMNNWCGTSACAIGFACVKLKSVRKAGLRILGWNDVSKFPNKPDQIREKMEEFARKDIGGPGSPWAYDYYNRCLLSEHQAIGHVLGMEGYKGLDRWRDAYGHLVHDHIPTLSEALFGSKSYYCKDGKGVQPEQVSARIREAVAYYGQSSTTSASTTSPSGS